MWLQAGVQRTLLPQLILFTEKDAYKQPLSRKKNFRKVCYPAELNIYLILCQSSIYSIFHSEWLELKFLQQHSILITVGNKINHLSSIRSNIADLPNRP